MSALACRVRLLTVFTAFTAYPTGVLVSMKGAPFAAGLDAPDIREGRMAFPFIRECHSSAFMASTLTPFPRRSLRILSTSHPFFSGTADELNSSKALMSFLSLFNLRDFLDFPKVLVQLLYCRLNLPGGRFSRGLRTLFGLFSGCAPCRGRFRRFG